VEEQGVVGEHLRKWVEPKDEEQSKIRPHKKQKVEIKYKKPYGLV
jgi:hypothetical protein